MIKSDCRKVRLRYLASFRERTFPNRVALAIYLAPRGPLRYLLAFASRSIVVLQSSLIDKYVSMSRRFIVFSCSIFKSRLLLYKSRDSSLSSIILARFFFLCFASETQERKFEIPDFLHARVFEMCGIWSHSVAAGCEAALESLSCDSRVGNREPAQQTHSSWTADRGKGSVLLYRRIRRFGSRINANLLH